jgi:hypothetical protein
LKPGCGQNRREILRSALDDGQKRARANLDGWEKRIRRDFVANCFPE